MVAIITKIVLFLLPLQEAHQWTLLGHPGVQKVRNHHPQDLQVHQTKKTRLQVHRGQKQCHQNLSPVETVQHHHQRTMLHLRRSMQRNRKLHVSLVQKVQTQQVQRIKNRVRLRTTQKFHTRTHRNQMQLSQLHHQRLQKPRKDQKKHQGQNLRKLRQRVRGR